MSTQRTVRLKRRIPSRWIGKVGRLLSASATCSVVLVRAQDPVEPWLRYHLGKVVILPGAQVQSSYTDNLFSNQGALRVADGITAVSPGIKLKWDENAVVDASLEYRHGETLIWERSEYNSNSDTVDAKVGYSAAKWKVTGNGHFSDSRALQTGNMNIGNQLLQTTEARGAITGVYDWTAKSDLNASLNYRSTDYDSFFFNDQQDIGGQLGASYEVTPRLRMTLDGKGGSTVATPNAPPSRSIDSTFYGGLIGLRGSFTQKLSGSARVGYETRQFDIGGASAASTPAFGLELKYQLSPLTQLAIAYDRSTSLANWQEGQITILDTVSIKGIQAIGVSGRWFVLGNGRLGFGDYQWDVSSQLPGALDLSRSDWSLGLDLALQYRPQPWLACAVGYAFDRYQLQFDDPRSAQFILASSYVSHRVFLSVSVGY